jgi:Na+-transporting methylmalonyl-CoA/oxaloacetate decarboxylase gamma subunit
MDIGTMFLEALKLMGVGVGMVFAVLAVFYLLIKTLMILLPEKRESKPED